MRTFRILLLLGSVVWATNSPAQFLVDVVMPAIDKNYFYDYEWISCNGNNCTASAVLNERDSSGNVVGRGYNIVFFRSKDGGLTWTKQDPGFPKQGATNHNFRKVQQIDSLNVVAISDTGLVLRSYDAGNTWVEIKPRPTTLNLSAVHFADPMNGIIVPHCDTACNIFFTTKDGGKNWTTVTPPLTYKGTGFFAAECYGEGKYAVLPRGYDVPIFLTTDNWETVKRIETYNVEDDTNEHMFYRNFKMSVTRDTILVAGTYFGPIPPHPFDDAGIVRRSVDGGATWEKPLLGIENNGLERITGFERNTLVAMGALCEDTIHISTDLGGTWQTEFIKGSFIFQGEPFPLVGCYGVATSSTGIVAILGHGARNFIAYHPFTTSDVVPGEGGKLLYLHRIYPNPVSDAILNIASVEESTPFRIIDMLGRVVLNGMAGDKHGISVNVSHLEPGVYFVYVDDLRYGHPVFVGKATLLKQ